MRVHFFVRLSALMVVLAATMGSTRAEADPGLLLVAHGSHSPKWNGPVLEFGQQVAKEVQADGRYKAVRTAMLEMADPDIPTAVAQLEAEGCDRIVAVPLFVAPSGHTHFDVPAVLGIFSSPRTSATLAEEGAKVAKAKVPIMLTQTLSESSILRDYALAEVKKLSKNADEEAIVILAHGDPEHELLCERILRGVASHCCGKAGIGYADWAFIGVGQEYEGRAVPAIRSALEQKKRVLVVGLYLSTSPARIHQRVAARATAHGGSSDLFGGREVVLSEGSIIQYDGFLPAVVKAAEAALATPVGQQVASREAAKEASAKNSP